MSANRKLALTALVFIYLAVTMAPSLQIGGRNLYFAGDYLRAEDTEWLVGYIDERLDKSDFNEAEKALNILAQYCPPEKTVYLSCCQARFHYATVNHRDGYAKFEELYKVEEAAFVVRGAPAPDDIAKENNSVISAII
ncbi:MAG: hypothetical protein L0213_05370, partial [Candidatus Dadabacteria bacterium]|nr:hypothetical protein [Candidatus Dadabacteria bacterium]